MINEQTENPAPIDLRPTRNWDRSVKRFGDTINSRKELGFEAHTPLAESISRTVRWIRENISTIECCITQRQYFLTKPDTRYK